MRITFFMANGAEISGRFGDGSETPKEFSGLLTTVRDTFLDPEHPEPFEDENGLTVLLERAHVIYMKGAEGGI